MIDLPVADPWFVSKRVDGQVTLVTEPHVHPLLRCNVWQVQGRTSDLVIDTSLGLAPLRHLVDRELANGLLAVATHFHSDHIGGLHEFSHRAVHRAEVDRLTEPVTTCLESLAYGEDVVGPYRRAGYRIPELFIDAVPVGGLETTVLEGDPVPATRVLDGGEIIDLGDRSFEVLHLPGHSPGSIGLWERPTGILFSGDAVYDGPLLDELDGSDVGAYVTTIRRLRELPVTVVHGGHEPSFGRTRLIELCDLYLAARG